MLLVGNAGAGTVSFVYEATFTPLGSLDVIPDLQQRLDEMSLVERAGYEIVRAENGDKFVDDMFVSPDGQPLYVSRSNLPDVVAIDLLTHEQVWRYEIEGFHAVAVISYQTGEEVARVPVGDRLLVLPTLHTSADQARLDELNATFDSLNDPNLIATVHFYGFWPFSVNIAGFTTFNDEVRQDLIDTFDRVRNAFVNRGIPAIIGEYGLLGFDRNIGAVEQGEKLKFFEFLGHYARTTDLTTMLWDNGQHFNRTSLQWNDPEFFAQVESSWSTRSGTASADQVFVERSGAITGQTLTLNPNGTSFQGLRHGNTDLVQGTDYTVSGNQLTLTASLLTELTGAQEYGVNADLHARSSQGVPWRISVITYDTPILQNATGTTGSFAIPAQFRGDRLATMEAVYDDGSFAGPQNWTSFKEFSYTFEPDYNSNTITLTPEFFAEVNDSTRVTLTFHFWSGETLTYFVTKSGSNVTGTTA